MRIRQVHIKNFRCLEEVNVTFEEVTTFLGPNGVGKSTALRALDWFFNGSRSSSLTIEDVYLRDPNRSVTVEVEFDQLSSTDRERLGKYAPPEQDSVIIARHWTDGEDKIVGRGRVFPPFEEVRSQTNATARRTVYKSLKETRPELDFPTWSNDAAMSDFMTEWEANNSALLESAEVQSSTHFFGFAGQAKMTGLFDFIFVSADMRAAEEATDSRSSVVGRILEHAVDRSGANEELAVLLEKVSEAQREIQGKHFDQQLRTLSQRLTESVSQFAAGRSVHISSEVADIQPQRASFAVSVIDRQLETRVERQGHGFQRALLIAALRVLADRGRGSGEESVICLAIEEPELYQHPLQARTFAAVLRSLAEGSDEGVQVIYATHSPYFIEARSFHQIRRVTRHRVPGNDHERVQIAGSTVERIVERLDGYIDAASVRRQLDGVCMGQLSEAFFADIVLLVEGTTERAVLTGVAARESVPLLIDGIFVGEAGGKTGLLLPNVILNELGIRVYTVADNDSHLDEKLQASIETGDELRQRKIKEAIEEAIVWNRKLLRFFGHEECDWPKGSQSRTFTFVDGGLEQALKEQWPAWGEAHQALIEKGVGFSGKNSATYEEAAIHAEGEVPALFKALLDDARALRDAA